MKEAKKIPKYNKGQRAVRRSIHGSYWQKNKTSKPVTKGGITTTITKISTVPKKKRSTASKKKAKKSYKGAINFKW